ncbi:aldo/keto reductase [Ginsengibacter hankyongi]|uniref:Aldo/keto reductase n=1 Tax=Ginsengibacter hankyongi TaxID=2607284 RepID=A0A5J5ID64_9BACT|nr:aldo/keto reductase [Ginsengibacter hankyongi]KAA9036087.1 aldo/keto reductase [Ginsengibacter hankyongi]
MELTPTYKPDIYKSNFPGEGSRLVYGTSGLGGVWGKVEEQESIDCILYALENDIFSFDTSPSYSKAELYLGKALAKWRGETPFVSTKVGRLKAETAFDAKLDYSPKGMRESLMRSLDLLGLNHVDLLFLHEPQWVPIDRINEILETLLSFREEGYTKMLGIGGNPSGLFATYIDNRYFQVISSFTKMDACNLSAFEDILPKTIPQHISFYAASSLHFGLLGNRFEHFVAQGNKGYEDNISLKDIERAVRVNALALRNEIPLAELAQRYLFSVEEATRVVMGARKLSQVTDTVSCWKVGALSKSLFDEITQIILGT